MALDLQLEKKDPRLAGQIDLVSKQHDKEIETLG